MKFRCAGKSLLSHDAKITYGLRRGCLRIDLMTRTIFALPILFTFLTVPAIAQIAEDKASVEACLKTAEAWREEASKAAPDNATPKPGPEAHLDAAAVVARSAAESCIGIVADPCMQTDEGSSTYGMQGCIERELEVWDARLNAAYKDAISSSSDNGLDAKANEVVIQNYRAVQRAWIPWRDATCDVLHSDGIPIYGSQSKVDGAYCSMRLTAQQALRLEGALRLGLEQ
jgi:uncharacterized protein YecT (DUF1311 family)